MILGFAWSFNLYINQESPTINVNSKNNLSENTNKIKLFENYSNQTLRIAVLNGCGISGVGNSYGNILTNRYGLQVTRIENADNSNYEKTKVVIINQNNNNIANLLTLLDMGMHHSNVEFNSTPEFDEDIQIIIGKDYKDFINLN